MDLFVRAEEAGVDVQVIHNASIMNAIGACGLQLYNFGQTITVPFFTEQWRPDSFYEKIEFNTKGGLHTLCLVGKCVDLDKNASLLSNRLTREVFCIATDIKVKEPDYSALMKGKKVWLPPRFMSVNTCIKQLLEIEEKLGRGGKVSLGLPRISINPYQALVLCSLYQGITLFWCCSNWARNASYCFGNYGGVKRC